MDSAMDILRLVLPLAALLTLSTRSSTAQQLITPAVSCASLQTSAPVFPPGGIFNVPTINVSPSSYTPNSNIQGNVTFPRKVVCDAFVVSL